MNVISPSQLYNTFYTKYNNVEPFESSSLDTILARKIQETERLITKLDNLKILKRTLLNHKLNLATRIIFEKQKLDSLIISTNQKETFETMSPPTERISQPTTRTQSQPTTPNLSQPTRPNLSQPTTTTCPNDNSPNLDSGYQNELDSANNEHNLEIATLDSEDQEHKSYEVSIEDKRNSASTIEDKIKVEEEIHEYYNKQISNVENKVTFLEKKNTTLQQKLDTIKNLMNMIEKGGVNLDANGNTFNDQGVLLWSPGGKTFVNIDQNGNIIKSDIEIAEDKSNDESLKGRLAYLQSIVDGCGNQGETFIEMAIKQAKAQNYQIEKYMRTKKGIYDYRVTQVSSLNFTINILFWLYCILSIAVIYIIVFSGKFNEYNKYVRYLLASSVILYPYLITPLFAYLVSIFTYILHMITGETYDFSKDYDFIADASYIPDLPLPSFIKRFF